MSKRCAAFADPDRLPEGVPGAALPTCGRDRGHDPPHRASVWAAGRSALVEWSDPSPFEQALRALQDRYGREAIRMWVERAPGPGDQLPQWQPWAERARWPEAGDRFMQDTEEFEPVSGGGPSITVDRFGGTYSATREPIPVGWRGWPIRARLCAWRLADALGFCDTP